MAEEESTSERDSGSAAGNEGKKLGLHQSNWFCYRTKLAEAKEQ